MRTSDFHYELPPERIAQHPAAARESSRLMVLNRGSREVTHREFRSLPSILKPGDLLILNNSKVIPARLHALKPATGARIELLLVEDIAPDCWWVMAKPAKRLQPTAEIEILDLAGNPSGITARFEDRNDEGHVRLRFSRALPGELERIGEPPLPPYIARPEGSTGEDRSRYQTVFAEPEGSVAAPTAGLHFTSGLLDELKASGVDRAFLTLHVGLGTFAPVKTGALEDHRMHEERFELPADTVQAIDRTRAAGGRVVAVGTTSVRVLESVARQHRGGLQPGNGRTRIFIRPPAEFHIVDALITNFHLPESTLLMLVSAFAAPGGSTGRGLVLDAYREAIDREYRFFSYGDAMLIE